MAASRLILIGWDGSDRSRDAAALAAVLARVELAAVGAVTVVEHGAATTAEPPPRDLLPGVDVSSSAVEAASPAEGLHAEAERLGAELVVLGSTHRGLLGRVTHGTVAGHLLHGAPCGVAVAPAGYATAPAERLARVAVAYDSSAESERAVERAASLAIAADATLRVLSVVEATAYDPTLTGAGYMDASLAGGGSAYVDPALIELARDAARGRLDALIANLPDEVRAEGRLLEGRAAPELLSACAEGVDLLVLGSRGQGTVGRVFLGSTSSRVIRDAPCPVWVVPAGNQAAHGDSPEPGSETQVPR